MEKICAGKVKGVAGVCTEKFLPAKPEETNPK
jgi:hypothetical protein